MSTADGGLEKRREGSHRSEEAGALHDHGPSICVLTVVTSVSAVDGRCAVGRECEVLVAVLSASPFFRSVATTTAHSRESHDAPVP